MYSTDASIWIQPILGWVDKVKEDTPSMASNYLFQGDFATNTVLQRITLQAFAVRKVRPSTITTNPYQDCLSLGPYSQSMTVRLRNLYGHYAMSFSLSPLATPIGSFTLIPWKDSFRG